MSVSCAKLRIQFKDAELAKGLVVETGYDSIRSGAARPSTSRWVGATVFPLHSRGGDLLTSDHSSHANKAEKS